MQHNHPLGPMVSPTNLYSKVSFDSGIRRLGLNAWDIGANKIGPSKKKIGSSADEY